MKSLWLMIICFLFIVGIGNAQNVTTSTIQWNADQTFDATEGLWSEEATTLTTFGNTKIEWKDSAGNIRNSFQVVEVMGQWNNANVLGSIQFEVRDSNSNFNGTITIRRDATGIKIQLALAKGDPNITELSVQNFQTL